MRILIVARRWWPAVGGAETFTRALARALAARHEVRVVAARIDSSPLDHLADGPGLPNFAAYMDGGVRVDPLALTGRDERALAPIRGLRAPLTDSRHMIVGRRSLNCLYATVVSRRIEPAAVWADIVHVVGLIPGSTAALRAARRARTPAVLTPFLHAGHWADDAASRATYRTASRLCALQRPEADALVACGVPAERVVVTGACIADDEPRHTTARAAELRRGLCANDRPLVACVGARLPHKGAEVLLAAAQRMRTPAVIVLAGPGTASTALPPSHVTVVDLGQPDDSEIAALMRAADLVCAPSSTETFGLVVLEAWRAQTPVLTSQIDAFAELVGPSGGGWTAERDVGALAAALDATLSRPAALRSAGIAGHDHWRRNFSASSVAIAHEDVYLSASGGR